MPKLKEIYLDENTQEKIKKYLKVTQIEALSEEEREEISIIICKANNLFDALDLIYKSQKINGIHVDKLEKIILNSTQYESNEFITDFATKIEIGTSQNKNKVKLVAISKLPNSVIEKLTQLATTISLMKNEKKKRFPGIKIIAHHKNYILIVENDSYSITKVDFHTTFKKYLNLSKNKKLEDLKTPEEFVEYLNIHDIDRLDVLDAAYEKLGEKYGIFLQQIPSFEDELEKTQRGVTTTA